MGLLSADDVERAMSLANGDAARIRDIVREVAALSGIPASSILSDERRRQVVLARDLVAHAAYNRGFSFSAIGRALGRDHTSIMAAVRREGERRG